MERVKSIPLNQIGYTIFVYPSWLFDIPTLKGRPEHEYGFLTGFGMRNGQRNSRGQMKSIWRNINKVFPIPSSASYIKTKTIAGRTFLCHCVKTQPVSVFINQNPLPPALEK